MCDPLLEIDLGCKSVNCDDEFGSVKQFGTVSFVIFLFFFILLENTMKVAASSCLMSAKSCDH